MKIVVTGGAGFIGSHLVDSYITAGNQVAVIDNLSSGVEENLNPKADFYNLDIGSQQAALKVKKLKPDILNLHAAQIDIRKSVSDPLLDAQSNILGHINLLQAAKESKSVKKIIFASTGGAIYGDARVTPTAEDYPAWPISPYGIAKLTGEHYLYYYQQVYAIPFVSLRYSNVYGPRQNPHSEAGVVAIFCSKMISNQQPIINGNGKQTRDYVYISDVVKANLLVTEKNIQGIYNISTGVETDINSIFRKLSLILAPDVKEVHGSAKEGEQQRSVLDCSKAQKDFDWKPEVNIDQGLQETAEFFKNK